MGREKINSNPIRGSSPIGAAVASGKHVRKAMNTYLLNDLKDSIIGSIWATQTRKGLNQG